MAWAYVENGVVVDRVRVPPENVFYPGYASKFIEAPDDVDHGWTYDGTTFLPPVIPPIPTAQLAGIIRAERDARLSTTDWTQAADVPQATKDKWAPYRQALRDVPQQAGFPDNIQWPSKPE